MAKYSSIMCVNLRKKRKIAGGLFIFFFILIMLFVYTIVLVNPLLTKTAKAQVEVYAHRAMNLAIAQAMSKNITYDDLIKISTNSAGEISLIEANSVIINTISKEIGLTTMNSLASKDKTSVAIPLGSFSGIPLFSGIGPRINVNIMPYGDVKCLFESKFISAGINQTQHKIYLNVNCEISVIIPFSTVVVSAYDEVLLCESVILGEIPSTYLNSKDLTEMLSLTN